MPVPAEILGELYTSANDWWLLAILWHVYFGVILLRLIPGNRPSRRLIAVALSLPLLSVATLALLAGNDFNSRMFALLFILLNLLTVTVPAGRVTLANAWSGVPGTLLFLFGWGYPHFLEAGSYTAYLYAAPLGVVPCATLAAMIGLALVMRGFESFLWSFLLAVAGLFYGVFGALYLQVEMDWVLVAGALLLLYCVGSSRVRADKAEESG